MASLALVLICSAYFTGSVLAITSLNDELFSGKYEFFDLSHPFNNVSINWPLTRKFEFTKIEESAPGTEFYSSKEYASGEHVGTHIDAPYHFWQAGKYVGDLPLENLIVPLIIVDISSKVNGNPNFVLYKQDLDYLLNDNFGKPCLIIFKFGWSKYYNDKTRYLGLDQNSKEVKMNFPGLSGEIMEWITKSYKNVVGVGVDVASVDPGSSTDYIVHRIGSKAGLYNIENVNLSVPVPEYGCTALVLPMKIALGTGAPLRLVAICPRKLPDSF